MILEGASHIYFYHQNGRLYHPWAEAILDRFEPHPILVGVPHPGKFGELSHDDMHRRTTVNEGIGRMIVALGVDNVKSE